MMGRVHDIRKLVEYTKTTLKCFMEYTKMYNSLRQSLAGVDLYVTDVLTEQSIKYTPPVLNQLRVM